MIDKIAFLVPTRGRPENVHRLAQAFTEQHDGYADLIFVVDGDHPEEHDYSRAALGFPVIFQPWRGLCATLNIQSLRLASQYKYVGFMGDDHIPRTPCFDEYLRQSLEVAGDYGIVYGSDGQAYFPACGSGFVNFPNPATPHIPMTWWCMDSKVITLLGQMVPWVLSHTCCDDYVWELGYQSGTLYFDSDVTMEHLHPLWGKAETDESYELSSNHHNRLADHVKWKEYQNVQLHRDVRLIKMARGDL